jgi:transcriptional regulator with XRE-family HTH domain
MVNDEDFAKRIKKLLSFYGITAAQMADKIGVQRSSISHLLSGRNKPSLDFVIKVINTFEDVDLYWLLNGKGNFPKTKDGSDIKISSNINIPKTVTAETNKANKIEHIIIFYKDGSFKKYEAV